MSTSQIRAYVPQATYLEQKQEACCPVFHEDLAILEPEKGYRVLASRGLTLKAGYRVRIPAGELDFLERNLLHSEIIAVKSEEGILLILSTLFSSSGLLLSILPHGEATAVAYALSCMGDRKIRFSPDAILGASACREADEVYNHLAETLALCDRILALGPDRDFRLHCAHVAQLAGCRANVLELPVGAYPLHATDFARWTTFLLGVFLSLRGDSAKGSQIGLVEADRREFRIRLSHQSEHQRKISVAENLRPLLELSAFSGYTLSAEKDRFIIETKLQRRTVDGFLGAPTAPWMQETLVIEILFGEAS